MTGSDLVPEEPSFLVHLNRFRWETDAPPWTILLQLVDLPGLVFTSLGQLK